MLGGGGTRVTQVKSLASVLLHMVNRLCLFTIGVTPYSLMFLLESHVNILAIRIHTCEMFKLHSLILLSYMEEIPWLKLTRLHF